MNIFIVIFILILNIVNVFAMYKLLGENVEKKDKIIFIAVGVAIMYGLVSLVYFLSGIGIDEATSEAGRDLITFTFVPVNGLCTLTFFTSSYKKYKDGKLGIDKLRNRIIVLFVLLVILLIGEFFYFKNIQNNALELFNGQINNSEVNTEVESQNNTEENSETNAEIENEETNTEVENRETNNIEEVNNIEFENIEENSIGEIENKVEENNIIE